MTDWVLLPREPSEEMCRAGIPAFEGFVFESPGDHGPQEYVAAIYRDAVAAAPSPGEELVEKVAMAIFDANHAPMSALKWQHAATPKARYRKQARAILALFGGKQP